MTWRILLLAALAFSLPGADLKVGIIGLDTSHVIEFTKILNDPSNPEHVPGARVVAGYPGGSADVEDSRTRIDRFTAELKAKYGVEIVPDIPSLLSRVDAVLLESVDGRRHLEQVRPVFAARKRVFIDKPLASTYADAKEIARLGRASGTPWFSTSSLRYAAPIQGLHSPEILGAFAWGPAPYEPHHQLDLSWYGIHVIEMLYAVMGTGCETVSRTYTEGADLVVGRWRDGRIGVIRGARQGKSRGEYGLVAHTSAEVRETGPIKGVFYSQLLSEVVKFFQTGVPPVPEEETLEIFAFLDAAQRSKEAGGLPMRLER
ncbi:MAG: Gfo/Idh/MocA family oxidoreductase [Acidobacteria bacterium]|nr:Gfo/Idh/MocA family oxidoreductase [Acidobacteriota bacterium]